MNLLELEYTTKRHKDWVSMAQSFGAGSFAEDVVQEMYLKLATISNPERILYKGDELNGFYIYVIIKNLVYDLHRVKKQVTLVSLDEIKNLTFKEYDPSLDNDFEEKIKLIETEVEGWHWYDKQLFKLYHHKEMSIRKLSKETKISTSSIFNTLKNGKEKIKQVHETQHRVRRYG